MKHIVQVFIYEFRRSFRRRGFLFATFGIPLIAFVLYFGFQIVTSLNNSNAANEPIAAPTQEADENLFRGIETAGYVDLSGRFPAPTEAIRGLNHYPDEAAAQAALDAGQIDVYYVIEADYLETGDVTLVMPRFYLNRVSTEPIRRLVMSNFSEGVDTNLFSRLVNPASFREVNLQRDASGETTTDFGADFAMVYIFALVLLLAVFTTNGYLMQGVIEEKETRLIEILTSSMRPTHLLAGKILAFGLLGLVQVGVWIGAVVLFGRLAAGGAIEALAPLGNLALEPGQLILFVVYFVLAYLYFAASFGAVAAISNSMQEGPQYAVIFTLPAIIPFYLSSLFTTSPDGNLAVILSLIPFTSPLSMVMRLALTTVPFWQIVLSLGLLILLDIGMIWLAGRLFRVQSLLAGQVPKLRDIPRLLRG